MWWWLMYFKIFFNSNVFVVNVLMATGKINIEPGIKKNLPANQLIVILRLIWE